MRLGKMYANSEGLAASECGVDILPPNYQNQPYVLGFSLRYVTISERDIKDIYLRISWRLRMMIGRAPNKACIKLPHGSQR
jgi:hypothetical protein